MALANRIKRRRLELGISVSQVARRMEEPASSYIEWENGRNITGERIYPKLCEALNMSLSELILGEKKAVIEEIIKIEHALKEIRRLS